MTTAIQPTQTALIFGDAQEIESFARRIKMMMRGGEKLSVNEAMALAQVAKVTGLNPFIGEVWYIPGSGPMIGIAGARRIDQKETALRGGYSTVEVIPCSPQEAGALESEAKDVAAAFRAEITDSIATREYQKMFLETISGLRAAGVPDPVAVAREICGPRPKWVGYGFSKKAESTKMNKTQAARKRSEADALKKKVIVPFGTEVAETDVSPDYVDAAAEDVTPKQTQAQNLKDLGFESDDKMDDANFEQTFPAPEAAKQEAEPLQMYRYNDSVIIGAVMKALNYDRKDAAETMYQAYKSKKIGATLTIEEVEQFCKELIAPK